MSVNIESASDIYITLDIDWAPDEVIEYCVVQLRKYKVKSTFFVTHESPFLKSLVNEHDIEIGVHPNYLNNKNFENVIDHLLECYPSATSVKAHALYSSSCLVKLYQMKGFKVCSDILLPNHPNLVPVWRFGVNSILITPYFWEDGNYFTNVKEPDFEIEKFIKIPGMKIFNFHPIHIFTNTSSLKHYTDFKKYYNRPSELIKRRSKLGTGDFFSKLLMYIATDKSTKTLRELYELNKAKIYD